MHELINNIGNGGYRMKNQVLPSISELLHKPIMILNSLANPESIT